MAAAGGTNETASAAESAATVEELVRTHLPLVGHLVREVLGRVPAHVNRDDLVSAGMLALAMSAKNFDAARGVPFGRFAAIRIRGALTDELRTMDWASRAVRGKAREIETVRNELAAALGRTPSRDEIAHTLGVAVHELDTVEADVQRASILSIQGLTDNDGADLLSDRDAGPEGLLLHREQLGILRDAIAELPDRLRTVVEEYFFAQRKMADIAADLGVTESRVSQLRSEALAMLRAGMQAADNPGGEVVAPMGARRANVQAAYCAAVATRSTLAGRLQTSTLLGEARHVVATRRIAN